MRKLFLKLFLALTALLFGFSKMVAAQYGVVVNYLKVQGKVVSADCGFGIPGIFVKAVPSEGDNQDTIKVVTSENGSFSIDLMTYWEIKNRSFIILTQDPDGDKNRGEYLVSRTEFIVKEEELKVVDPDGWTKYYESSSELLLPLNYKGKKPCE
jgi:hypothetical protein